MQILPAAGRALKVGNAEVRKPTITASVRSTRQPAMPYLKETGSDSLNRILFCFATTNAGAARITRLRRMAEVRGPDTTRWFDGVNIIGLEQGLRETARCVTNIAIPIIPLRETP